MIEIFISVDSKLFLCSGVAFEQLDALLSGIELCCEQTMRYLIIHDVIVLIDLLLT